MSFGYVKEKLFQAVLCLVSSAPLERRLEWAAGYLLRIRESEDFPDDKVEKRERFKLISEKLFSPVSDAKDGYIRANIAQMSDGEQSELAEQIVEFAFDVMGFTDEL